MKKPKGEWQGQVLSDDLVMKSRNQTFRYFGLFYKAIWRGEVALLTRLLFVYVRRNLKHSLFQQKS